MSTTLRIRRRTTGGSGAPSSLKGAELAYNEVDGYFYVGFGDDGSGGATSIKAFAKDDFNINQRVPAGGTTSQALVKNSNADNDVAWATITSGGTYSAGTGLSLVGTTFAIDSTVATKTYVTGLTLDQLTAPAADLSINSHKLTNVTDPTSAQDAATKNYVDNAMQGMSPKEMVKAASTANIASLSGTMTVDGVSLVAGDAILLKDQSTASQNGIYLVASGAWSRRNDADAWGELVGASVFVDQGTANASSGFFCNVTSGGTLGTTSVTWVQYTGAGEIVAGNGVTKIGNTLSLNLGTGLAFSGSSLALTGNALALQGLSFVADSLAYGNGTGTLAITTLSSFGRSLIDDADASTARGTLGLGTMATQAASAVAITGGTIDGVILDGGTF
jgi:hypothetical protein